MSLKTIKLMGGNVNNGKLTLNFQVTAGNQVTNENAVIEPGVTMETFYDLCASERWIQQGGQAGHEGGEFRKTG